MHTFFINTSQKNLDEYEVLFDIHYESKALVSLDCPLQDWYDEGKGYLACVKKMGDMIDGYVEINNAFNLIIYIDLLENEVYSSIPRDAYHDQDREECCRAMHILFTHMVSESVVQTLVRSGRSPQNVLLMFGEEKKFTDFTVAANDPSKAEIMKRLLEFIGLPDEKTVVEIARAIHAGSAEDKVGAFGEKMQEAFGEELIPGIRSRYPSELQIWYEEVINAADVPGANLTLFNKIGNIHREEVERRGIEVLSCPYDGYASRVNKVSLTLSQLNIALFLLQCVENNSIYQKGKGTGPERLIPFHSYTVEELAPIFEEKERRYSKKVSEIQSMAKSYSELKLAPKLSAFDYAKFGLDVYGGKATELVVSDVTQEEKEEEPSEEKKDADAVVLKGKTKEVSVVERSGRALFSREEYPPFDYEYESNGEQMLKKNTTPEQYIEQAKNVRRHHIDYLKKLKMHVSDVLSHYAGKSKENKPALLQIGGYRYAGPGEEERVLESVKSVSEKAYGTVMNQYMEFCAGRSVAVTDIEEQCDWFISRVSQIKESLCKIQLVALGLLLALILLYIPFVVIQFEAIVENVLTLTIALASVAVPIVILYAALAIVSLTQKKKYLEAWKEFKERSDRALEENTVAAQKYDRLLSSIIPALRWVYEYKLDVDYCAECCSVADAKIEHHRGVLQKRISAIRNILSDLEYRIPDAVNQQEKDFDGSDAVDYTVSFCTGKKNRAFYSIIDGKMDRKQD